MRQHSFCSSALVSICLSSFVWAVGGSSTEHVLYNGKIFTGEPDHPYAEAVAIHGDKIVAVGTKAEATAAVGKGADTTDLQGRCLLPGLIDSHEHSIDGGVSLITADGVYDASLLLADALWSSGQIEVEGDIVVAAPAKGPLLVTGSRNRAGIARLRALAAELPADRIMVETDAPYLAPGKFRGKRNEPAFVVEVARVLAEARGVSLDEISRQTTENFFRLFSKVPRPAAA